MVEFVPFRVCSVASGILKRSWCGPWTSSGIAVVSFLILLSKHEQRNATRATCFESAHPATHLESSAADVSLRAVR